MEGIGVFLDEEWESLSKLFSSDQEDSNNLLHHLKGSVIFQNQAKENYLASGVYDSHHDLTNNTFESMDFYTMDCGNNNAMMPVFSDDVMEEILQLKAELHKEQLSNAPPDTDDSCKEMQLKRKCKTSSNQTHQEKYEDNLSESDPKKKPRVTRDKNKRNAQSKKNKKADQISSNEEENNSGGIVNSSSTSNSEDDSINASEELNSKGKGRASRGSATDRQSLYARRRRERINERLKILQNLVPNGTKVDISTMLEEAVHYVKFLQLQIKLLSSDDLWMYAPIAYNGMNIGLYQMIVPNSGLNPKQLIINN